MSISDSRRPVELSPFVGRVGERVDCGDRARRRREKVIGLAVPVLLGLLAAALPMRAAPAKPAMSCAAAEVNVRHVYGRCTASNVDVAPEWRLYGASDDEITDYDESMQFHFEAERQWRLVEMRTDTVRLRAWVRANGRTIEYRAIGREGDQ